MTLVWDNFTRGGSDKLAMLAMADWCNDQGGSLHPSVSTVAKKISLTEKQARVILHRLIVEGWLQVIGNENGGNPGQSRQYVLNIQMLLTPPVEVTRTTPAEVTPNLEVTPPVEVRDPSRGGSFTPPVGGSLSTNDPSISTSKDIGAPATRLPADWVPSETDIQFCQQVRPDLNVLFVADGFKDYWIAVAGAKGRKLDWAATWRNWIRRQQAPPVKTKQTGRDQYFADAAVARDQENGNRSERDITGEAQRVA